MTRPLYLAMLALALAAPASADVTVRFIEGAPKDRFVITATDDCLRGPVTVAIDLTPSAGALIFDTSASGAGVEVFQPLEIVAGGALITALSAVTDGSKRMIVDLQELPVGTPVAMTTDLDDTIGAREITVAGAEIAGATVALQAGDAAYSGVFDQSMTAVMATPACQS